MVDNEALIRVTELINDSFLAPDQFVLYDECGADRNHPDIMRLQITSRHGIESKLYRFDLSRESGELFPIFADIEGLKRICDYVIFCVRSNRLYVLCIELKRGQGACQEQLDATKLFMRFLLESAIRIGLAPAEIYNAVFLGSVRVSNAAIERTRAAHNSMRPCLRVSPMAFVNKHLNYTQSRAFVLDRVLDVADSDFDPILRQVEY